MFLQEAVLRRTRQTAGIYLAGLDRFCICKLNEPNDCVRESGRDQLFCFCGFFFIETDLTFLYSFTLDAFFYKQCLMCVSCSGTN